MLPSFESLALSGKYHSWKGLPFRMSVVLLPVNKTAPEGRVRIRCDAWQTHEIDLGIWVLDH